MSNFYYLMDLERTIGFQKPYYWLRSKCGYCSDIELAGLFSEEQAKEIISADFDNRTVMIHRLVVNKIIRER